jgi:hypothetical protein
MASSRAKLSRLLLLTGSRIRGCRPWTGRVRPKQSSPFALCSPATGQLGQPGDSANFCPPYEPNVRGAVCEE